jgi:hypothetical protein
MYLNGNFSFNKSNAYHKSGSNGKNIILLKRNNLKQKNGKYVINNYNNVKEKNIVDTNENSSDISFYNTSLKNQILSPEDEDDIYQNGNLYNNNENINKKSNFTNENIYESNNKDNLKRYEEENTNNNYNSTFNPNLKNFVKEERFQINSSNNNLINEELNNNNNNFENNNMNNQDNNDEEEKDNDEDKFYLIFNVNDDKELFLYTSITTPFKQILIDLQKKYDWLENVKGFKYNGSIIPLESNSIQCGISKANKIDIIF